MEASQGLAQRILKEGGQTNQERANYGYLLTTGRPATSFEAREIAGLVEAQSKRLADGWLDIRKIAFKEPDTIPDLPEWSYPKGCSLLVHSFESPPQSRRNPDQKLTSVLPS